MKKIIFLTGTILLLLFTACLNTYAETFSDIQGHWAEETIIKWQDKGIISGYPDGTFKPDNSVTRAELAKVLTIAFDLDKTNKDKMSLNKYSDVNENDWYYPYLEYSEQYIPVYPLPLVYTTDDPYVYNNDKALNGFLPNVNAIRMHTAEALVRLKIERENITPEIPDISDLCHELGEKFKDGEYGNLFVMHSSHVPTNVQRLNEYTWLADKLGIMEGYPDGYFLPHADVTRAYLITMIDRMF